MSITGLGTVAVFVLALVLTLTVTVFTWDLRRARRTRRGFCLLLSQALLLLSIGTVANRQLRWFSSWSDFVGTSSVLAAPANPHAALDRQLAGLSRRPAADRGYVVDWVATGAMSRIAQHAKVYLPAAYFSAAGKRMRFPVVELLAGFPGGPDAWLHPLRVAQILDSEINAGRMAPAVVVMPVQNVSAWRDSECVNAQGGPQLDTYLTADLQASLGKDFRTASGGAAWGLMGYSTGGFCAVNLALRHRDLFGAAVSLSGYFVATTDATTGDLYRRYRAARNANSPLWLVQHASAGTRLPYLYLAASKGDPADIAAIRQLTSVLPPQLVQTAILPGGGHNFRVWRALEPAALDWLSAHLSPPLAAAVVAPS